MPNQSFDFTFNLTFLIGARESTALTSLLIFQIVWEFFFFFQCFFKVFLCVILMYDEYFIMLMRFLEAVSQMYSVKNVLLEISQNPQEKPLPDSPFQ